MPPLKITNHAVLRCKERKLPFQSREDIRRFINDAFENGSAHVQLDGIIQLDYAGITAILSRDQYTYSLLTLYQ